MLAARAPYAVEPNAFRFPALAAAAGRAPLGGQRETTLGVYLAVRLADDAASAAALPAALRAQRAVAARAWVASLAIPAAVRRALTRLLDATETDGGPVEAALQGVTSVTAELLPPAARLEVEQFATSLRQRPGS